MGNYNHQPHQTVEETISLWALLCFKAFFTLYWICFPHYSIIQWNSFDGSAHLDKGAPRTCTRRRRATCWGRPSTAAPPRAPVPDRRRCASPEGTTLSLRPAATRLRIHYRYTTLADLGGGVVKSNPGSVEPPLYRSICTLWLRTQMLETVP